MSIKLRRKKDFINRQNTMTGGRKSHFERIVDALSVWNYMTAITPAETWVSSGGFSLFLISEASPSDSEVKQFLLLLSSLWLRCDSSRKRDDWHQLRRQLTSLIVCMLPLQPTAQWVWTQRTWGERSDKNQSKSRKSLDIWSVLNYPWLNCADVGPQWKQLCLTNPADLNEAKSPKQLNTVFRFLSV